METITIPKGFKITPQQFEQLANTEQLTRMELTKEGELIIASLSLIRDNGSRKFFLII